LVDVSCELSPLGGFEFDLLYLSCKVL
jgi:hypothetical protein